MFGLTNHVLVLLSIIPQTHLCQKGEQKSHPLPPLIEKISHINFLLEQEIKAQYPPLEISSPRQRICS